MMKQTKEPETKEQLNREQKQLNGEQKQNRQSANNNSPVLTYAEVVKSKLSYSSSKSALNSASGKDPKAQQGTSKNTDICPDGFVEVERRRNKTKRIFLSETASSVNGTTVPQ